jgi:hypothetical protein
LFVAGRIDSMQLANTQKVSRILCDAREGGLIPWEWIVDETRSLEAQPSWSNLEDFAHALELSYRRDFWSDQDYRVIVISEKGTVGGLLRPVLDQYGIPFFAAHGFNSATKVHELAEDIASDGRQTIFLYVGDHDPSGMYMSEVDFPGRLERYGANCSDFDFTRIALTADDTPNLPSFAAKKQDPRFQWYRRNYGNTAWELDAMDPNALRDRVEWHVREYVDLDAWDRHQLIEAAQQRSTKMVAAQLAAMDAPLHDGGIDEE